MARDRQRAKQRQAARRAERLAERRADAAASRTSEPEEELREDDIEELADLEVGAPPEDVGRSDTVLEAPPNPYHADAVAEEEPLYEDEVLDEDQAADGRGLRGRRGRFDGEPLPAGGPVARRAPRTAAGDRSRLVAFLVAVWAELGRVQWPDRRQLLQLTGVVLFFVLVVGGYLGGLDAIFSKLVSLIL